MRMNLLVVSLGLLTATALRAADWPQFQGPDRSNVSKEVGLMKMWPKEGPKLLWTFTEAGVGYSTPSIVGDLLYITGADDKASHVFCVDIKNGKQKWKTPLGKRFTFNGNQWGDGPRAAPTVADGLVYALDGGGEVVCLEADSGKVAWKTDLVKNFGGAVNPIGGSPEIIGWGFCAAPIVDGDQVVFVCGGKKGAVVALEKKTGKLIWQSSDIKDEASYSSPVVANFGGVKQYVVLFNRGVAGVDAKTGKTLWFYDKKPAYGDVLIPAPILDKDHVFVNNGMGAAGCDLIKIEAAGNKFTATKVYANKIVKSINGGQALVNGHVYGYSDKRGWLCVDFLTGKDKWAEKNALGSGSLTYADGHLYLYGEDDGVVKLIEASDKEWKEKGSFEIPQKTKNKTVSGKNWTYPVIANGKLYLRDQELLFCYEVK